MVEIFNTIQAKTATLVGFVDLDSGQLAKNKEGVYPTIFPCALLRFEASDFTVYNNGSDECTCVVTVVYAEKPLERTHSKSGQEGLAFLERLNAIHAAIQLREGTTFSPLSRDSLDLDVRADLRVATMRYTTQLQTGESQAYIEKTSKIPKPPLGVNLS